MKPRKFEHFKRSAMHVDDLPRAVELLEKMYPFIEQMAHRGKCRNNSNLRCMSCDAEELIKEILYGDEWAQRHAAIKYGDGY